MAKGSRGECSPSPSESHNPSNDVVHNLDENVAQNQASPTDGMRIRTELLSMRRKIPRNLYVVIRMI